MLWGSSVQVILLGDVIRLGNTLQGGEVVCMGAYHPWAGLAAGPLCWLPCTPPHLLQMPGEGKSRGCHTHCCDSPRLCDYPAKILLIIQDLLIFAFLDYFLLAIFALP